MGGKGEGRVGGKGEGRVGGKGEGRVGGKGEGGGGWKGEWRVGDGTHTPLPTGILMQKPLGRR